MLSGIEQVAALDWPLYHRACSITTAEDLLRRSEGKAEDVQIEWTEAEVYSNIVLDMSFA